MTLEINDPSRYTSAAATRALSLAVRAAPVMMDSRTPTTGLMRSVMPGRLSDYRGVRSRAAMRSPSSEVNGGNSPSSCAASTDKMVAMCGRW